MAGDVVHYELVITLVHQRKAWIGAWEDEEGPKGPQIRRASMFPSDFRGGIEEGVAALHAVKQSEGLLAKEYVILKQKMPAAVEPNSTDHRGSLLSSASFKGTGASNSGSAGEGIHLVPRRVGSSSGRLTGGAIRGAKLLTAGGERFEEPEVAAILRASISGSHYLLASCIPKELPEDTEVPRQHGECDVAGEGERGVMTSAAGYGVPAPWKKRGVSPPKMEGVGLSGSDSDEMTSTTQVMKARRVMARKKKSKESDDVAGEGQLDVQRCASAPAEKAKQRQMRQAGTLGSSSSSRLALTSEAMGWRAPDAYEILQENNPAGSLLSPKEGVTGRGTFSPKAVTPRSLTPKAWAAQLRATWQEALLSPKSTGHMFSSDDSVVRAAGSSPSYWASLRRATLMSSCWTGSAYELASNIEEKHDEGENKDGLIVGGSSDDSPSFRSSSSVIMEGEEEVEESATDAMLSMSSHDLISPLPSKYSKYSMSPPSVASSSAPGKYLRINIPSPSVSVTSPTFSSPAAFSFRGSVLSRSGTLGGPSHSARCSTLQRLRPVKSKLANAFVGTPELAIRFYRKGVGRSMLGGYSRAMGPGEGYTAPESAAEWVMEGIPSGAFQQTVVSPGGIPGVSPRMESRTWSPTDLDYPVLEHMPSAKSERELQSLPAYQTPFMGEQGVTNSSPNSSSSTRSLSSSCHCMMSMYGALPSRPALQMFGAFSPNARFVTCSVTVDATQMSAMQAFTFCLARADSLVAGGLQSQVTQTSV